MNQTKIEDRAKATMEEVTSILSERRSEDDRYSEDAGIGEIPLKTGDVALVGTAAGDEQQGTINPPAVQAMKAEDVEDDKKDDDKNEENAFESSMREISSIIGERRSADVRAAEDEPVGNVPGAAKMTGATMGYIPWKVGEAVAVTVPATQTTSESMLRASVQAESAVDGKLKVRIESEGHKLKGRVMEWPATLVSRIS
jgi:hypothetical protein